MWQPHENDARQNQNDAQNCQNVAKIRRRNEIDPGSDDADGNDGNGNGDDTGNDENDDNEYDESVLSFSKTSWTEFYKLPQPEEGI